MATVSLAPPAVPAARALPVQLEFVEGLRALAALWVVLSHLWIFQFGLTVNPGRLGLWSNWLLYSHLAVDVFIVLSGFCLTLPVLRDGTLRGGAAGFLWRRARRILPPFYLALALSVGIALVLSWLDTKVWGLDLRALGANLLLMQDLNTQFDVFNGPLWSIAVEWRIYLVFPLLLWALRRGGLPGVLLPAAAVGYGLTALILWKAPGAVMACPWYLLLFALGMCAASVAFPRNDGGLPGTCWRWVTGAALTALVLLLRAYPMAGPCGVNFGRHMPVIDAAVGALVAALLVGLSRAGGSSRRDAASLGWPPLATLGRFSYSLYLTHAPLLAVLYRLLNTVPVLANADPLWKCAVMAGLGLPLLLALAYGFFLRCERPFWNSRPYPPS